MKKPRIAFLFVEAGLGHIMPMKAIADAFAAKYGDKTEIVNTYFYQDKHDPRMSFVESELVREVKGHNANRLRGAAHFALLRVLGTRLSMGYLLKMRYGRGYKPSLNYIEELNADVLVNTHFATGYYAAEAKKQGRITSKIVTYCPDPVVGLQWDNRLDLLGLSNHNGYLSAKKGRFKKASVVEVPFLIRKEVKGMRMDRAYYRQELNLPTDSFTVLLADGAYGAGRLRATVLKLLKSKVKMTVVAVCGKNEQLYKELQAVEVPPNIHFALYGFTDKTLQLAAACDLFVGKAGASNLAEPAYFAAPEIITFQATKVEQWISSHYEQAGTAVVEKNIDKAVQLVESFAQNPSLMQPYEKACAALHNHDGAEIFADALYEQLISSQK